MFSNSVSRGESYDNVPLHILLNITWGKGLGGDILIDKKDLNYLCEKEGHEYMKKYMKNVEELNEDSEFVSIISPDKDNEMVINTLKNEAMKEGIEKNTLETAKKMLDDNLSIDMVSKYTGLSKNEIKKL